MQDDSDWDDDEFCEDDDDDSVELIACPHCSAEIYEDAVRCPVCGEYIIKSTSPMAGRPLWFVLLGLAGIIAVIVGLARLF